MIVEPAHIAGPDLDNDDRARMILPFVEAYRKAYYYHTGPDGEPDEPLGAVIADMIGNLCHLADRVEADIGVGFMTAHIAWHRGWAYYEDEREEENGQQEAEEGDNEAPQEDQPVPGAVRDA